MKLIEAIECGIICEKKKQHKISEIITWLQRCLFQNSEFSQDVYLKSVNI